MKKDRSRVPKKALSVSSKVLPLPMTGFGRKISCVCATVLLYGAVDLWMGGPVQKYLTSKPDCAPTRSYTLLQIDALFKRFSQLPNQRKKEILDKVIRSCDATARSGDLCDSIVAEANPRIMTVEEYKKIGRKDPYFKSELEKLKVESSDSHRMDSHRLRGGFYNTRLGVIVLNSLNLVQTMDAILYSGLTPKLILAHETLHQVQNQNSPQSTLLRYLVSNEAIDYDSENGHSIMLSPDQKTYVAQNFPVPGLDDVGVLSYIAGFLFENDTSVRDSLFEMSARCLTPTILCDDHGTPNSFDITLGFLTDYNISPPRLDDLAWVVARIYGLALRDGEKGIYVRANAYLGKYSDSFPGLIRKITMDCGKQDSKIMQTGLDFLYCRSKAIDLIKHVAARTLEEELEK